MSSRRHAHIYDARIILLYMTACLLSAASRAGGAPEPQASPHLTPANIAASTAAASQNPLDATNVLRSFIARGIIREFPAEGHTVIIRHEDIPGFMPKMTMEFNLHDTNELRNLKVGDTVLFRVKANEEESWIENIQKSAAQLPAGPVEPSATSLLHVAQLKPGDLLPDGELVAEDGKKIRFSDYQGKVVAFTFIFTRCPLPDFCPRMNQDFSRAREILISRPNGPTNWQFLSVSFDSEFDQPGVLSRYARLNRGKNAEGWIFAAAPNDVLASMAPQLDFRFLAGSGGFAHNLRTVVLDSKRRIFKQFEGNKWKPEELAESMVQAAKAGEQP